MLQYVDRGLKRFLLALPMIVALPLATYSLFMEHCKIVVVRIFHLTLFT